MALSVAQGTYTGTGAANAITGLGFTPKILFIKAVATPVGDDGGAMVIDTMPAGNAHPIGANGAIATGYITSIDADGFTVPNHARTNSSGVAYYYCAFAGTDVATGSYAGSTVDVSVTGVAFQPVLVVVAGANNRFPVYRDTTLSGDATAYFANVQNAANMIESITSDGFTLGTGLDVNVNGVTFYYACFKASNGIAASTFTGDGADGKDIAGVGFQPTVLWVKVRAGAAARAGIFRNTAMGADNSAAWNSAAAGANLVQSLDADGFEVGTDVRANESTKTVQYIAFRSSVAGASNYGFIPTFLL